VLWEIFRFELRYHLRSPLFWLSGLVMFLLAFGAVTSDAVTIGGSIGNVHRNAPFVIMQLLLVMSAIGIFVTTAFVAGAVLRDYDFQTHEIFFSTPMKKRDYLIGRFAGAWVAGVLIFVSVALAIMIGATMPWLEAERIGPFTLWPYVFSFLVLVLPNVFLMSGIFFSVATMTRSMMYTYVSLIAFFVGYAVAGNLLADLENEKLAAVLDPFGLGAFGLATKYWTTAERNTQVLALDGPVLQNRLLWVGIALAVLGLMYVRFSFTVKESRKTRRARKAAERLERTEVPAAPPPPVATSGIASYSLAATWTQLRRQTRHEVAAVLKSLPFQIILAMGVLNAIGGASVVEQMFGTSVYPRTHLMLQVIQGSFLLFAIIILTVYAGEIVWRERKLRLDEVYDALPVPNWVLWGSKLVALFTIVLALMVVAMLAGMGIQLWYGYTEFELALYFKGLFLQIGIPFLLIAVLALFLQTITNNKYVGYLLMVLYFISTAVLTALDFDHNLYRYASAPSAPYSDMNGFGHFVKPVTLFHVYWTLFAVILLVLAHVLWVRGKETGIRQRLALARQRMGVPSVTVLALAATAFVGVGGYIFYNTNVLNEYIPSDVAEARQVRYENEYKQYERIAQPRITAIQADVDIFPDRRAVDIRGVYKLRNKTEETIDTLHLTLDPRIDINRLELPDSTLEVEDDEVGYYIYRLAQPLRPGQEFELTFDLAVRNPGFVNNGSDTRVVYNGTFISSGGYFPHIGYSRGGELGDPVERRRHDLPPIQRLPSIDDEQEHMSHMLGREADWVEFETTVSTSADQIALAPGYLIREWEQDGRRYFHYKMDAPILAYFSYLSARWNVVRDRWNDVEIAVYHHPGHAYNVERMIEATKKCLDYFTASFGPYQHRQFRIIEFPRYARFAEAFPNTIPFSESIGFIARLDDEDAIDYVFYVTAHELAHQWWAHQVIGAGVQGATVMVESMAQYSALMVMEQEYGPELMRRFLKYELDSYLRGRGGELIEELPLMLVENQPYIHYRKGSLVMYALRDHVGEQVLNEALARYVADVKFQGPPYTTTRDFLSYVREAVPDERLGILEDLFKKITLYENRAQHASWKQRDDGKYVVKLEVESRKYRADGQGQETEIPVDDWIDIGVFGERGDGDPPEGKVLALEKRRFIAADGMIELVVDEVPRQAGIDPFNKLIDRNPENNLTPVAAAS
jgi:ABC-type transport system involved in multi-copper enzyme maturation permease subunit